jgi:S-DNA-T family DNA segregation ATPase FtsK/SpoIIIE
VLFTISDLASGASHEVALTAPVGAHLRDIESILTQFLDRPAEWRMNGQRLHPDDLLVESGLCDGAILQAAPPVVGETTDDHLLGVPKSDEVFGHLRVVGGPDAGTTWTLGSGIYVIGRSKSADLRLPSDGEVSRQHARLQIDADGAVIEDLVSSNGTTVAGVSINSPTRLSAGEVVEVGDSLLTLTAASGSSAMVVIGEDGTRTFNRPPRILPQNQVPRISVPVPPGERQRSTFSIAGIVLPLIIGGAMALLVRPIFILFALLSPAMAVSTYISDRRKGIRSHRGAVAKYQESKALYTEELKIALERETLTLRDASPDPAEVAAVASGPLVRLWERRRTDPDFMEVRVGLADRPASVELIGGVRPDSPDSLPEKPPVLHQIPATVSLSQVGVLGVAGGVAEIQGLARWLVVQLATLHAPDDVRLVILAPEEPAQTWDWSMWLPHLRMTPSESIAAVGIGEDAFTRLADQVASTIDRRTEIQKVTRAGDPIHREPAVVVVLGAAHRMRSQLSVAKILALGPAVDVYSICLAQNDAQLPEECRAVATFPVGQHSRLDLRLADGSVVTDVVADKVNAEWAEDAARALAPLRLDRKRGSGAGLPDSLVLLDLLEIEPPTGEAICASWARNGRTTSAVIGATPTGPLEVDLQRDGPHGLIAGTTGSGKSELLQTLIASLAVANRPDALNFVLVDYKGGSAFEACARLPHTVGMVTDLDGHLTERALASLAAELRRRERIFRDAGVKDIDDYWRLVAGVEADRSTPTMPRILIVIDEFASLVEELPDFVDGLVDLGRRGRSLGIHLILATQRPAGVVSPSIKTNTNLRIAMRVTDAMDSTDVIDSQLAARIPKSAPGRGYMRIGHEQMFEFQAARVGGRRRDLSADGSEPSLRVVTRETVSLPKPQKRTVVLDNEETDLTSLVKAITDATNSLGITAPNSPWLPPLPKMLMLSDLAVGHTSESGLGPIPFGLEDVPTEQARTVAALDLEFGSHLLVAGDPGSGRSTLLRTIAASAARTMGPADLHMYAIDCGNGALLPLVDLPHCGAVVSRAEVERVDRLIAKLLADIEHRQRILATGGFSNLSDQRMSVPPDQQLPFVLVLLDRWEGFNAAFEGLDGGRLVTSFQHLLREGPGAGVRVVVTGDRTVLVGRMATMAEFRLVLRLNDRSSYSLAGLNPRHLPEEVPAGRAFRADSGQEIQVAVLSPEPTGPAQVLALRQIAEQCHTSASTVPRDALPEPVSVLPSQITLDSVLAALPPDALPPLRATIGVGGNRLDRVDLDLHADGPGFIVMGPRRSGRSNALVGIAKSLAKGGTSIIGVVSLASPLEGIVDEKGVVAVFNARSTSPDVFTSAVSEVQGPLAVLVDDVEQILDTPFSTALEGILRGAREHRRSIVIAGNTAELNTASFRGLVAEARKSRAGLILSPGAPVDAELFGVRLPKTTLFSGPAGRAVQIANGGHRLVQLANAVES